MLPVQREYPATKRLCLSEVYVGMVWRSKQMPALVVIKCINKLSFFVCLKYRITLYLAASK